MAACLEIDSVFKRHGEKTVLSDVYLKIETGNIVSVFGSNGSGKSTLFRIIYGIEPAQNCFIRFNKTVIPKPFKVRDLIAFCPQEPFFPKYLSVQKALEIFYKNEIPPEIKDRFSLILTSRFDTLSGGEAKLLQLFTLLHSKSKFIILDEPFNHLSPLAVAEVQDLILEKSRSKGILISDHSYHNVLEVSTLAYLLKDGRLRRFNQMENPQENGYL